MWRSVFEAAAAGNVERSAAAVVCLRSFIFANRWIRSMKLMELKYANEATVSIAELALSSRVCNELN